MQTPEEKARIARENGAKSKGPKTAAGKEQSRRNAIKHGEGAAALKLLVPPHSALLIYEERREFYRLFDANLAKYRASDDHEKALVREITGLPWSNMRARLAIHAMLNRELLRTGTAVTPITAENSGIENSIATYDSLAGGKTARRTTALHTNTKGASRGMDQTALAFFEFHRFTGPALLAVGRSTRR